MEAEIHVIKNATNNMMNWLLLLASSIAKYFSIIIVLVSITSIGVLNMLKYKMLINLKC